MPFKVTWLGQGGYLFEMGEKRLCVDPYLSDAVFEREGLRRIPPIPISPRDLAADIILCTHDHIDHLDEATLCQVDDPRTRYGGPDSCLDHLRKMGIAEEKLIRLGRDQSFQWEGTEISGVFADHTPDSIGIILRYRGLTVYLTGDTLFNEQLLEARKYQPDLLISCINGKWGNMDITEAAELARGLGVQSAIPSHYGMFAENTADPAEFERALEGTAIASRVLEIGKLYRVSELLEED